MVLAAHHDEAGTQAHVLQLTEVDDEGGYLLGVSPRGGSRARRFPGVRM